MITWIGAVMNGSGDGFDDSEVAFKVWVNNQPHGETHMGPVVR